MFVPKRKPGAYKVAASQTKSFKGCHIYLEAGTDCKFWRFFIDKKSVKLHACKGWEDVVDTIKKINDDGIPCVGIIDNDFRSLIPYPNKLPGNVFTTDDHDIEIMVLKTEAAQRVTTHYDASGKIEEFEQTEGNLMEFVWGLSDRIGLLKLVNQKESLNMTFKHVKKDQTIEIPKYEDFLDNSCHFISDKKMITYLCGWSSNYQKVPNKQIEEIETLVNDEASANYDSMQLSCGHDACYILAYVLKKRIVNKKNVTQQDIEDLLSVSYSVDSLRSTQLYQDLEDWSQGRGIRLLRV